MKIKRGPKDPTENEDLEHEVCHLPFRSWCSHCVAAAAKASPHVKAASDEKSAIPLVVVADTATTTNP